MNKSRIFALITISTMLIGILTPIASAVLIPPSSQEMTIYPTFRCVFETYPYSQTEQQYAIIVTNNAQDLGIQAEHVVMKLYVPPYNYQYPPPGSTYDQGGFDTLFSGYLNSPEPNPYALFDGSQWSPLGYNYYFWNNSAANALDQNVMQTFNTTARIATLKAWQAVAYDDLPSIAIAYSQDTVAFAKGVNGTPFSIYQYPLWCPVEQWKYIYNASDSSMILAQIGPVGPAMGGLSLSPAHTTSYYDQTGVGAIFGEGGGAGLMMYNTSWFMIPYLMNTTAYDGMPNLYNGYQVSADHMHYNVTMMKGVRFQDGEPVDGRDLVATLRAYMTPAWNALNLYYYNNYLGGILGTDNRTDTSTNHLHSFGNYSVWYAGEPGTRGANWPYNPYEIGFALPAPWVYFENDILGLPFYPGSLLTNSSSPNYFGSTPLFIQDNPRTLAAWKTTSFANGVSGPYTYTAKNGTSCSWIGPMSYGPFEFNGLDITNGIFKLARWDGYFRMSDLKAAGLAQIKDFSVKTINSTSAAISALRAGKVQVLDSNYKLGQNLTLLDPSWSGYVQYPAWGVKELGFNMQHPIFGTGVNTPLGQAYPSRAAEGAYWVRHAIEWLVPKDYIIKNVLKGGYLGLSVAVSPQVPGFNTGITIRNATQADATYNAIQDFERAGYQFVPVIYQPFWDTYGPLLSVLELAVVVVLAGFIIYMVRRHIKWFPADA